MCACVCSLSIFQEIRANITSPLARFAVSNLHPGSLYIASVYAFNAKGRSDPAVLPAAMLRLPEKQLTSEKGMYCRVVCIYITHTAHRPLYIYGGERVNTYIYV